MLIEAAEMVDERIREQRSSSVDALNISNERLAIATAVNLASDLINIKSGTNADAAILEELRHDHQEPRGQHPPVAQRGRRCPEGQRQGQGQRLKTPARQLIKEPTKKRKNRPEQFLLGESHPAQPISRRLKFLRPRAAMQNCGRCKKSPRKVAGNIAAPPLPPPLCYSSSMKGASLLPSCRRTPTTRAYLLISWERNPRPLLSESASCQKA